MTTSRGALLSKSRYVMGTQCPRLLWVHSHEPQRIPEPDAGTRFIFDQGHEVGILAKQLFPGGIDIPTDDLAANLEQSRDALESRRPLFEAAFMSGGMYARADILEPHGDAGWNLIEVKSTTSVKQVHLADIAFQRCCLRKAGVTIDGCYIAHINNEYVRNGAIVPGQLFRVVDVSDMVDGLEPATAAKAEELLTVMQSEECPHCRVGPHCAEPYECPLRAECWEFLPDDSVFTLYHAGRQAFDLMEAGHLLITDLPENVPLNRQQRIQRACLASGALHIEPAAIRSFLASLSYPVHYLDFETIGTAIPIYDGVRPYQQVPFQFSLHVVRQPGDAPEHHHYLGEAGRDTRLELLQALGAAIGDTGSVVAYHAPFEKGVLRSLALAFPEWQPWTERICERIVDLLVPFRGFNCYHPLQRGSASLKAVLPALTGLGYDRLAVSDGQLAGLAFLSTLNGMPAEQVEQVRADLLEYCGLDTSGMISIVERLSELSARAADA